MSARLAGCLHAPFGESPDDLFDMTILLRIRTALLTAFFEHVLSVLFMSCSKQVVGVHAWRIVATMANNQSVRNVAHAKKIRKAIGSDLHSINFNPSIPVFIRGTVPNPAISRSINQIPKDFWRPALISRIAKLAAKFTPSVSYPVLCFVELNIAKLASAVENFGRHIGQSFCSLLFRVNERLQPLLLPPLTHIFEHGSTKGFM